MYFILAGGWNSCDTRVFLELFLFRKQSHLYIYIFNAASEMIWSPSNFFVMFFSLTEINVLGKNPKGLMLLKGKCFFNCHQALLAIMFEFEIYLRVFCSKFTCQSFHARKKGRNGGEKRLIDEKQTTEKKLRYYLFALIGVNALYFLLRVILSWSSMGKWNLCPAEILMS